MSDIDRPLGENKSRDIIRGEYFLNINKYPKKYYDDDRRSDTSEMQPFLATNSTTRLVAVFVPESTPPINKRELLAAALATRQVRLPIPKTVEEYSINDYVNKYMKKELPTEPEATLVSDVHSDVPIIVREKLLLDGVIAYAGLRGALGGVEVGPGRHAVYRVGAYSTQEALIAENLQAIAASRQPIAE